MEGAGWKAGFVQSHSVLVAVEVGEKKKEWIKSLLYTLTVSTWLVLSHVSHSLWWRLTGQRCIKCSAEPEQCNYPPSEARVCAKRFLSSMNELESEGLLAFMKGRKLQLSNYCFTSQEIWPPWSNVCVINLARQPEYVRTRVVTNAARNAPELLVSFCSWSTSCHQGVCSWQHQSTSASSQLLLAGCRYCGPTNTWAVWSEAPQVERSRQQERSGASGEQGDLAGLGV